MLKFLPGSVQKLEIVPKREFTGPPFDALPKNRNVVGAPLWIGGELGTNRYWIRLNLFNVFPILPKAFLLVKSNEDAKTIDVEIRYGEAAKIILRLWLAFAVIAFFAISGSFVFEQFFADGLVPYVFNDKTGYVAAMPWLLLFGMLHLIVFFLLPAAMINNGWEKTALLIEELKRVLEAESG